MERVIISLNWTCGTLLLIMALAYPALDAKFFTGSKKLVVQQRVASIAQWEANHYQTREQYILFSAEEMPDAIRDELGLKLREDFVYDAFLADNGQLVIRAQASADAVRSGSLPPLTYILRQGAGDRSDQGSWETLSGKRPGLF